MRFRSNFQGQGCNPTAPPGPGGGTWALAPFRWAMDAGTPALSATCQLSARPRTCPKSLQGASDHLCHSDACVRYMCRSELDVVELNNHQEIVSSQQTSATEAFSPFQICHIANANEAIRETRPSQSKPTMYHRTRCFARSVPKNPFKRIIDFEVIVGALARF